MAPAEINLLSAGAVAPGLKKICQQFERETGNSVKLTFATAAAIIERLGLGTLADVVIAPPSVLVELASRGKSASQNQHAIGRIGVGVMVREGAPHPSIATVEELKKSLLNATSVVFNRASTGTYLESLFQRLGIALELEPKSIRYPDFAAVLDHISHGGNGEIAFGATTVIIENANKGVTCVGPLPADIQNYTAYEATLLPSGISKAAAREFIEYLKSAPARSALTQAGIL